MSVKSVAVAAALTVASLSSSWATGGPLTFVPNTPLPSSTATFGASVSGMFSDTWTFNVAAPGAEAAASVTNISFGGVGGITNFAGTLASVPLIYQQVPAVGPVVVSVLSGFTGILTPGMYSLVISGDAGSGASYGGNVVLTPIPEPETYALMLAGLGVVGFVAARRRPKV